MKIFSFSEHADCCIVVKSTSTMCSGNAMEENPKKENQLHCYIDI